MKIVKSLLLIVILASYLCSAERKTNVYIGVVGKYAPFSYTMNSRLIGFEIDLVKKMGKFIDYNPIFITSSLDELYRLLDKEEIDFIANQLPVSREERRKVNFKYDFTQPYASTNMYFVVRKDVTNKSFINIFKGKKIGIYKYGHSEKMTQRVLAPLKKDIQNRASFKYYNSAKLILEDISNKKIFAAILTKPIYNSVLKNNGTLNVKLLTPPIERLDRAYMFKRTEKSAHFIQVINRTLNELRTNGTLSQLSMKWLNIDVTKKTQQ